MSEFRPIYRADGGWASSIRATFWQIHRSTIVNVNAIAAVTRDMEGHIVLKLRNHRESLPVSHPFAHLFRQM